MSVPAIGPMKVVLLLGTAATVLVCAGCQEAPNQASASSRVAQVSISVTPQGCEPHPATVTTDGVSVKVSNVDASAVSEVELRSHDLVTLAGEEENLIPGLSGGFGVWLTPGHYVFNCPGARRPHWPFTVRG